MLAHRIMLAGRRAYADEVIADSPVAWWRLDETSGTTANDAIGSNHGTYSGATLDQSPLINAGRSVSFSGSSSGISVADADALSFVSTAFTLECWVKTSASGSTGSLLAKDTSGSVWAEYNLYMLSDGKVRCDVRSGNSDTPKVQATTVVAVNDGNRHHVVATFTPSNTLKIYVDKVERASASHAIASSYNSSASLRVGRASGGSEFAGLLDEVALYASGLSAARVAAHYDAGV